MYYVRTLLSVVCQVGWGRCAPCENTVEHVRWGGGGLTDYALN